MCDNHSCDEEEEEKNTLFEVKIYMKSGNVVIFDAATEVEFTQGAPKKITITQAHAPFRTSILVNSICVEQIEAITYCPIGKTS